MPERSENIRILKDSPILQAVYQAAKDMDREVYLVGGGLRDLMSLGTFSDYDFAVKGGTKEIACAAAKALEGTAFELGRGDKSCFRVAVKEGERLVEIDFSPFKGDTIEKDLKKRDFTINAMALSLRALIEHPDPVIIDPLKGAKDLLAGRLKVVSSDAIDEDPLRILRGFRFAAVFSMEPDNGFLSLARDKKVRLKPVARERVRTELFKMLAAGRSYRQVNMMAGTGVLSEIIHPVSTWKDIDQGEHHTFDLLGHALKTLEYLEKILDGGDGPFAVHEKALTSHLGREVEYGIDRKGLLKLAALLHDSGKPSTLNVTGGKVTFHGHEEEGAMINKGIAAGLKMGRNARNIIANITRQHMRPLHLSKLDAVSTKAADRFIRDCGEELPEVLLLALADTWATRDAREVDYTDVEGVVDLIFERWINKPEIEPMPLLNGNEVMEITGAKEGAEVGRYLALIADGVIDGVVSSKVEAVKLLKKLSPR